jgi:hypothetical protein
MAEAQKYIFRALQNLTIFFTPMKRVDFSEVTDVRALSFRNVSVGEIPPKAGRWAKLPHRYVAEKTKSRSLDRETEEKPILVKKIGVMESSHIIHMLVKRITILNR